MIRPFSVLVILFTASCAMDDKHRCGDDLLWEPESMTCVTSSDDTEDTVDSDSTTEQSMDAGAGDAGSDSGDVADSDGESGLDEPCWNDDDCASYDTKYCALNPLTPDDPGYCTFLDCQPSECPGGYQCCDCTNMDGYPVACVKDADAALLMALCNSCGELE